MANWHNHGHLVDTRPYRPPHRYDMKKIESAQQGNSPGLTRNIAQFWSQNVNAERIHGRAVTDVERGEDKYFLDLEEQRYRTHYHIQPWLDELEPDKEILEIGCGVGMDSSQIAKRGLHLSAMDLTFVGVSTAKSRFLKDKLQGRFLVGDACSLPFSDSSFDYVYSFGVLHHTADTEKSIDEVYRVLQPGGQARIMLYNRRSLNELVHRLTRVPFEEKDALCPVVRRFTKKEVLQLFREFSEVNMDLEFVFGEGYGAVYRMLPRWLYRALSGSVGWHIMITATK